MRPLPIDVWHGCVEVLVRPFEGLTALMGETKKLLEAQGTR